MAEVVTDASALVDLLLGNELGGRVVQSHQLRLSDAVYLELAASRALPLITTDRRLHPVTVAEVVVV